MTPLPSRRSIWPVARRVRAAALAGFALLATAGCVTTSGGRAEGPPPPAPKGIIPDTLLISAGVPVDSDANGYADTIPAVAYLFAESGGYPLPIWTPGSFVFRLQAPDGRPLAEWTLPPAEVASQRANLPPGPGYVFSLRLLDVGTDHLEVPTADLTATFTPEGEPPVASSGAASLLLRR